MREFLNNNIFIERAIKLHGEKYNYSLVDYKTSKTKVKIICPKHGEFEQIPSSHLKGIGCKKCGYDILAKKNVSTTKTFIKKTKEIHGDKYDYSLVEYVHNENKIKIICPEHGEFEQTPHSHLNGHGCKKCAMIIVTEKECLGNEIFIQKAKEIHGDKYDYSLVNYVHSKEKVKIICPEHGEFEQIPNSHMMGKGCPQCANKLNSEILKSNTKDFIKKAKEIHGDKYDYSLVDYVESKSKVTIICYKHGEFKQTPANHINNEQNCPTCNESKGEIRVRQYLEERDIIFESQKRFDGCRNKKKLPFDFYLPNHNILVEYDGILHFKAIDYFGGERGLKDTQRNDKIKNDFAKERNIKLIRIRYNKNVEEVLNKLLTE